MLSYDDADPVTALTGAQRQRAYRKGDKGKRTERKYRHNNSKWTTDAAYLSRQFIAWDGEGITETGVHKYVLLANSLGEVLIDREGLSFISIMEWFLRTKAAYPDAINVGFGLGYDVNCWLADLSHGELEGVVKRSYRLRGYKVAWRPGKSFYVVRNPKDGKGFTIYDVLPFFQRPFVQACDEYLGTEWEGRAEVVADKARRGGFTWDEIERITEYNRIELITLVKLARELRERLNKVTLRPARWDGPGAVATALMTREGVKNAKAETPPKVAEAARYAYAGGRFEMIQWGVTGASYEHDVNSAYPRALCEVPDLTVGRWVSNEDSAFTLYHLRYTNGPSGIPGPLFCRHENGTVSYPQNVVGWYWTPEYRAAVDYVHRNGGTLEVLDSWSYQWDEGDPQSFPFRFIPPLFAQRRALKAAGDGAHVGIKLGLNSLYGKLAQQVGWQPATETRPMRIPPYHQIEWAGYTTSWCRAQLLLAVTDKPESVIAFETDAVFSTEPLNVTVGDGLGEWKRTDYEWLGYVQSGMHFGKTVKGKTVDKTRGVDRGTLPWDSVHAALDVEEDSRRYVDASLSRFVGARLALAQNFDRWRHWETNPKRIMLGPSGKRIHTTCSTCGVHSPAHGLHSSVVPFMGENESHAFPIEWINPDPRMTQLEELRREEFWEVEWE